MQTKTVKAIVNIKDYQKLSAIAALYGKKIYQVLGEAIAEYNSKFKLVDEDKYISKEKMERLSSPETNPLLDKLTKLYRTDSLNEMKNNKSYIQRHLSYIQSELKDTSLTVDQIQDALK